MPAKKSTNAKVPQSSARAKSARASAESDVLARLPKPIKEAIEGARERSHEFALAGLGAVSQIRKQSEERMAAMVKEGRRVEPKVKEAVEQWKESLQSRFDVKKFKLPKLNFSAAGRQGN